MIVYWSGRVRSGRVGSRLVSSCLASTNCLASASRLLSSPLESPHLILILILGFILILTLTFIPIQ